jgi:hypothetical protein
MASQAAIIIKYEGELQKINEELTKYIELFKVDSLKNANELQKLNTLQLSVDKGVQKLLFLKKKNDETPTEDDEVNYVELLDKLSNLGSLKYTLDRYYYADINITAYAEFKPVGANYNTVFNEKKVTKADGELFIKGYDDGSLKSSISDKYDLESADKLRVFFKENEGASCIDTFKKDAEACIERYRICEELKELRTKIEIGTTIYNGSLKSIEMMSEADGKILLEWKVALDKFVADYIVLKDAAIQKYYKAAYDSYVDNLKDLPDVTQFLELKKLANKAETGTAYYNDVVVPNRAAFLTTDAEIAQVKKWQKDAENYTTYYAASKDPGIIKLFKSNNEGYEKMLLDMPNKIKLLEDATVKAKKKDAYAKELANLSEKERIENNPDIGEETGSYKKKGKEPKEGAEDKVDKKNKKVLEKQGIYNEETGEYTMYKKGDGDAKEIDINDVKQGVLGDCYLISAIAGVAKDNPSYIKKLITYKKEDTFATVKLYIRKSDGTRTAQTTKIDFYFPVSGVEAAFAKAGDGELWVMVIEKAYAKLMGGYDNIGRGGDPGEALAVLTGNEAVIKDMSIDDTTLGTNLASVVVAGKTSVAGTKENKEIPSTYTVTEINPDRTDGYKVTLSGGNKIFCSHAYTVTGVDETAKKVKLRNPHGGGDANLEITFKEFRDCFTNFKVVDVPV